MGIEMARVVEAVPARIPEIAHKQAAQVEDAFGTGFGPEHAGLLEALANDGLAAGLDDTRAIKEPLVAEN